jgi:hypothetical protein
MIYFTHRKVRRASLLKEVGDVSPMPIRVNILSTINKKHL